MLRNLLDGHPVIDSIVAQLLYEPFFRGVVLFLLVLIPAVPLMLWPLMRASPEGFEPVVHVSGMDRLQSWNLRRTARREWRAGHAEAAVFAWRVAIANNPGDSRTFEELFEALAAGANPAFAPLVIPYSQWLLRLARTNAGALEICARVYDKFEFSSLAVNLLESREDHLSPPLQALYLKALFAERRYARFRFLEMRWPAVQKNSELKLYSAACKAMFDPVPVRRDAALETLARARMSGNLRPAAQRLALAVSAAAGDAPRFHDSLEALASEKLDRFSDHLTYWKLLLARGDADSARIRADNTPRLPQNGEEAVRLAEFYFMLGSPVEALETVERHSQRFPNSPDLWLTRCNLLALLDRWDDLRQAAARTRTIFYSDERLRGFAEYFEGLADLRLGRPGTASDHFLECARRLPGEDALDFAGKFKRLGCFLAAREVLLRFGSDLGTDPRYWSLLAECAYHLGDFPLLEHSLEKALAADPNNLEIANNCAAVLLARRGDPARSLALTEHLAALEPENISVCLNRASALIQNNRVSAGEALLRKIEPSALAPADATAFYRASFEAALRGHDSRLAETCFASINPAFLLPPERAWLSAARLSGRVK